MYDYIAILNIDYCYCMINITKRSKEVVQWGGITSNEAEVTSSNRHLPSYVNMSKNIYITKPSI